MNMLATKKRNDAGS